VELQGYNKILQTLAGKRTTEMMRQDKLLRAVNTVASFVLTTKDNNFTALIPQCMEMMAGSVEADRMAIWQNQVKDGTLYCARIYRRTAKGDSAAEEHPSVLCYDEALPGWNENFAKGKVSTDLWTFGTEPAHYPGNAFRFIRSGGLIPRPSGRRGSLAPVFLQGEFWGFMEYDDCTHNRIFSDVEEGSCVEAKNSFLANMSREIRTPINAIIGMSVIARQTRDPEKIHDAEKHCCWWRT
jgi:hypothetical protein